MAKRPRASRESVAYQQENASAAPRRQPPQPLRVVKSRPKKKRRRGALRLQQLMCFGIVLTISGTILYSQMTLTRLTDELEKKETAFDELQSETVSLRAQQDRALSLSYVEDYALNTLGMVKVDNNQAEYIEMNNPDRIEVSQPATSLGSVVSKFTSGMQAILEYLG